MYRKILIANRGEIAVRIIRSARELGIETVAIYSTSDKESMHVLLSDEAVCIGPPMPSKSYLNPIAIISAATLMGCDAVHPGYGFLSENAQFAENVEQCGLAFLGPNPKHIRLLGDKVLARRLAQRLEIPVIPGSSGKVLSTQAALEAGEAIGYPVLIKAACGGGGRGMKVIRSPKEMVYAFPETQKEVQFAFGNGELYVEKFLLTPRHIEVQIIGDGNGGIQHYGLRECSIQRRHQKILEEAQPANLPSKIQQKLIHSATELGRHIKYLGVGTVEFLVDQNQFFFIEMNTRIQVEHPITEMITKADLVKDQIWVSAHRDIKHVPKPYPPDGHAIECRINAEHAETFMPSAGIINGLYLPGGPGVRVDTFLYDQYRVTPHYDSLLCKIVCWDKTREDCISKMRRALKETIIRGIATNIPLHRRLLETPDFIQGQYNIHLMKKLRRHDRS